MSAGTTVVLMEPAPAGRAPDPPAPRRGQGVELAGDRHGALQVVALQQRPDDVHVGANARFAGEEGEAVPAIGLDVVALDREALGIEEAEDLHGLRVEPLHRAPAHPRALFRTDPCPPCGLQEALPGGGLPPDRTG